MRLPSIGRPKWLQPFSAGAMLHTEGLVRRFGSSVAVEEVTLPHPCRADGRCPRPFGGRQIDIVAADQPPDRTHAAYDPPQRRSYQLSAPKGRQPRAWRERCAMIFQQFNPVDRLDVLTNVLIGRLSYPWRLLTLVKCFSAVECALALDFGATSASCGHAGTIVAAHAPFVWPTWPRLG